MKKHKRVERGQIWVFKANSQDHITSWSHISDWLIPGVDGKVQGSAFFSPSTECLEINLWNPPRAKGSTGILKLHCICGLWVPRNLLRDQLCGKGPPMPPILFSQVAICSSPDLSTVFLSPLQEWGSGLSGASSMEAKVSLGCSNLETLWSYEAKKFLRKQTARPLKPVANCAFTGLNWETPSPVKHYSIFSLLLIPQHFISHDNYQRAKSFQGCAGYYSCWWSPFHKTSHFSFQAHFTPIHPLTSSCVAQFLTDHGSVPVYSPGDGDP